MRKGFASYLSPYVTAVIFPISGSGLIQFTLLLFRGNPLFNCLVFFVSIWPGCGRDPVHFRDLSVAIRGYCSLADRAAISLPALRQ
jgi:hypothetical protein